MGDERRIDNPEPRNVSNGLIARGKIWRNTMQDINFIKAKAVAAAEFLAGQGIEVKNTVLLEMLSRLEGYRNWSTFREQLAVTPAVSNPPTVQQALTMSYRWMASAPIEELEAVESALGENAPVAMAAEALKAAGMPASDAASKPQTDSKSKDGTSAWSPMSGAMTDAQYLALKGHRCPSCGGEDIRGGRMEVDGQTSWQKIECEDCNATWVDTYGLKGYCELEGELDVEAIQSVVEDIQRRAEEYGFNIDSEAQAEECIEETSGILDIYLNKFEWNLAVRQLMP
jgi:hypothetical protein